MGKAKALIGEILQGTYRIERLIGEGGMGAVYEASHLRVVRRFAIKVLDSGVAEHPEALARFQREALVTSALGHPHILEVIDFNHIPDGAPYIIMELLDGEDLAGRLRRERHLELYRVASIFRQASSALHAAHQQGIIHRDLKPQNIFLCNRGERDDFVKIVDFGISKVLGSQSVVTRTQTLMGTPAYMSPEQAEEKAAEVDLRTDVYAMGVILFEALSGRPPFTASSVPTLLYKIVHEQAPSLRTFRSAVPESVDSLISTALRKKREERYSSMKVFWQEFVSTMEQERIEFSEPTEDRQTIWTERPRGDATGPRIPRGHARAPRVDAPGAAVHAAGGPPVVDSAQMTTLSAGAGETRAAPEPRRSGGRKNAVFALAGGLLLGVAVVLVGIRFAASPREGSSEAPAPLAAKPTPPAPLADARLAVARAPAAPVDSRPPVDARSPVDSRRAVAARKTTRKLWLETQPGRASVRLGDRRLGETPLAGVDVPVTEGKLIISKPGYKPRRMSIAAGFGALRLGRVSLRPRAATSAKRPTARAGDKPLSKKQKPAPSPQPKTKKRWIIRPVIE